MKLADIKFCPGSLAEGFSGYSPSVLRKMFYGKKVSHILDFEAPEINEEVAEKLRQNSKIISISGVQFKQSLILDKNKLRLTMAGERGQYILKPIPIRPPFGKAEELPANEHLCMQIARQVYGISTAECALIFFKNGEPAYITKRFDIRESGDKIALEDFASLSELTREKQGSNYKYLGSYQSAAQVMKKYVSAYMIEAEKYFERVVFNFLFSNGDAHLKNFSLQQMDSGDYIMSPAYDLVDTRIHISLDSFFALEDGLFEDNYYTESFKVLGYYGYDDFFEFGIRIGLLENRVKKIIKKYQMENSDVISLVHRSFLTEPVKGLFMNNYNERIKMLNSVLNTN